MDQQVSFTPLSWVALDPAYENRLGYNPDFLGIAVPTPKLKAAIKKIATVSPLPYEHFTILLNPLRRLAFWTAVNIDGSQDRRLADRAADEWWFDKRTTTEPPMSANLQIGNKFYTNSGFQRGHLVRRLDPAWGQDDDEAARGEADSFHWTNCAPQIPALNTQWWLGIESHVLDTANAKDKKVTVFSGCVFTDQDPPYRGLKLPLAYWKVVAWVVKNKRRNELRSLAFLVKQDEAVAALLKKKGVVPLAVDFDDVPEKIQGYQTTVAELQTITHCNFGDLANEDIDVYARNRKTRFAPLAFNSIDTYRRLSSPSDLFTS